MKARLDTVTPGNRRPDFVSLLTRGQYAGLVQWMWTHSAAPSTGTEAPTPVPRG
jgi:hypothetical protein